MRYKSLFTKLKLAEEKLYTPRFFLIHSDRGECLPPGITDADFVLRIAIDTDEGTILDYPRAGELPIDTPEECRLEHRAGGLGLTASRPAGPENFNQNQPTNGRPRR